MTLARVEREAQMRRCIEVSILLQSILADKKVHQNASKELFREGQKEFAETLENATVLSTQEEKLHSYLVIRIARIS